MLALQVALIVASTAFVVLVACLIPILFRAQRQIDRLMLTVGEMKASLDVLVGESRELVQNVNALVARANDQVERVEEIVGAVGQWKDRAERLVNAVGFVVEAPVLSLARNMNVFRIAATTLLRMFRHRRPHGEAPLRTPGEDEHA